MTRSGIILGLCLSFLFLARGTVNTFRTVPLPEESVEATKKSRPLPAARPVSLYPAVPARLPDLSKGYLFNEERSLEGEGAEAGDDTENIVVNVEDVIYEGSLIIGDVRKGIISYASKTRVVRSVRSGSRIKRTGGETTHIRLSEGDNISGYKVVEISPDKIVFEKAGERLEKNLNDPSKQRQISGRPAGGRPRTVVPRQVEPAVQQSNIPKPGAAAANRNMQMIRKAPPPPPDIDEGNMVNPFETGR